MASSKSRGGVGQNATAKRKKNNNNKKAAGRSSVDSSETCQHNNETCFKFPRGSEAYFAASNQPGPSLGYSHLSKDFLPPPDTRYNLILVGWASEVSRVGTCLHTVRLSDRVLHSVPLTPSFILCQSLVTDLLTDGARSSIVVARNGAPPT